MRTRLCAQNSIKHLLEHAVPSLSQSHWKKAFYADNNIIYICTTILLPINRTHSTSKRATSFYGPFYGIHRVAHDNRRKLITDMQCRIIRFKSKFEHYKRLVRSRSTRCSPAVTLTLQSSSTVGMEMTDAVKMSLDKLTTTITTPVDRAARRRL